MSRTLSSYEWLLAPTERVIRCPRMCLNGWHDHQPPIFEGSGQITLKGSSSINFQFDARARDPESGIHALRRCAEEIDDRTSAMRLRATDYSGTEWNAGWVRPLLGDIQDGYHQLFGECLSLSTDTRQDLPTSGVELAYSPAPDVPFTEMMRTSTHLGDTTLGWRTTGGQHKMELLGSEIVAMTQPWSRELWISATTSEQLKHPHLENWLSEPLCALKGQLIYPRLVARNFADGGAAVWVRRAPEPTTSMGGCASQLKDRSAGEFWGFYGSYLTYVAQHRDAHGHPGFEANELTRLHNEVIQAHMAGSNWVIALCVASAIEGLVKLDPKFLSTSSDFTAEELNPVEKFIAALPLEPLRSRLSNAVSQFNRASPAKYLAQMKRNGHITSAQLGAWKKVRNQVAHGNLFEPWGSREEQEQLVALVELFYRLTGLRIGYF